MVKSFKTLILSLIIVSFAGTALFAQPDREIRQALPRCGVCEGAESVQWGRSWWGKITRGLTNTGFGWTNLIAQPKNAVSDGDNLLLGIGKGFGYTGLRTIQGVVEIVISWLPPVHDEPLKNCALGDLGITGR
jgi:hypothetical protein